MWSDVKVIRIKYVDDLSAEELRGLADRREAVHPDLMPAAV